MKKNIKMEDDDNNQKFDMSSPYVILIVIILLMWAFLRGTQPNIEINTADQILIYIIVGGLLWKSFETGIKNASPKAIGNGISTTTKGEPYCPFGIWDIFCINEIRAWGYETPRGQAPKKGAIIVPFWGWKKLGTGIAFTARLEKYMPEELPSGLKKEILSRGFKEPFYVGLVTEDIETEMAQIQEIIAQFKQSNRNVSMLESMLKEVTGTVEDHDRFKSRLIKLSYEISKEGFKEKLKKRFSGNEEINIR